MMTREEFQIYKKKLMKRFYWCTTRAELNYLIKEKGYRYLFRCTHFKTGRYFWVFDRTEELLKDVDEFRKNKHEENSREKEKESLAE